MLVELHLDVLGVLEFSKKSLAIDATLYDSRILSYPLSGDAAMRRVWGDDPQFAMSLGGFHPRLSPPLKLPKVRRLEPELSSSSSLESSCNCYKALTSNSLQFGSRVEFYGEESGASLEGRLCCDVLIYFSPFRFEADMGAGVTARCRLGREHRVEGHVRPRTDRHVATEYGGRGYRRRRVYVPSLATMLQQHGQAPGSRSHVRTL